MKKLILSFIIMILMMGVSSPVHALNLNEPTLYAIAGDATSTIALAYGTEVGEVIVGGSNIGEDTTGIFLAYTPPDLPVIGSLSFEYTMDADKTNLLEVLKYVFYPITDDISLGLGLVLYSKDSEAKANILAGMKPWLSMSIKLLNI